MGKYYMKMKSVTNESLQVLSVYLVTPLGLKTYILQPKEVKVVPEDYISENILKLQKRRMVSVHNYNN